MLGGLDRGLAPVGGVIDLLGEGDDAVEGIALDGQRGHEVGQIGGGRGCLAGLLCVGGDRVGQLDDLCLHDLHPGRELGPVGLHPLEAGPGQLGHLLGHLDLLGRDDAGGACRARVLQGSADGALLTRPESSGQLAGHVVQPCGDEGLHLVATVLGDLALVLGQVGRVPEFAGQDRLARERLLKALEVLQAGGDPGQRGAGTIDTRGERLHPDGLGASTRELLRTLLVERDVALQPAVEAGGLVAQAGERLGLVHRPVEARAVGLGRITAVLRVEPPRTGGHGCGGGRDVLRGGLQRAPGTGVRLDVRHDERGGPRCGQQLPPCEVVDRPALEGLDGRCGPTPAPPQRIDAPPLVESRARCRVGGPGGVHVRQHLARMGRQGRGDLGERGVECRRGQLGPGAIDGSQLDVEAGEMVHEVADVPGETRSALAHRGLGALASLHEVRLHAGVGGDVEEPLEDLPALLVGRPEEGREVALGEQDDPAELVEPHPEEVVEHLRGLVDARADGLPAPTRSLLELDPGLVRRRARAATLGTLVSGMPGDPQASPTERQLQAHAGAHVVGRMLAAQRGGHPVARHVGVEGVADRVEQARLAGPGRTVDEEEAGRPQVVQVEVDVVGEGTEGRGRQAVQPHAAPRRRVRPRSSATSCRRRPASRAAVRRSRSACSGSWPRRTSATKSQQTSIGARRSTREA